MILTIFLCVLLAWSLYAVPSVKGVSSWPVAMTGVAYVIGYAVINVALVAAILRVAGYL